MIQDMKNIGTGWGRSLGIYETPKPREKVFRSAYPITQEQYEKAIKPFYTKAKKLELGVTLASNLATIQRMRAPTKIINVQEQVLKKTIDRSKTVTGDVITLAGKQAIHESKITGMSEKIFSLEQQLKDRPVIEKPVFGFDLGIGDLKTPLIVAAAVIGAALFLPSIIGALKKK